jgi:hypothetical protein
MTRDELRSKEFSSGLRKLSGENRDYVKNLTLSLFFIENPPVCPVKKANAADCRTRTGSKIKRRGHRKF